MKRTASPGEVVVEDDVDIARRFFLRWGRSFEELCSSFEETLHETCFWNQRPMIATRTRRGAVRFLWFAHRFLHVDTIRVDLVHVARHGDTVFTDRVDHLLRADGSVIASAPVTGVLRFERGQIVEWREHFSALGLVAQVARHSFTRRQPSL